MSRSHTYIRLNKTELNELVSFMKERVSRLPPDLLARRRAQAIWFSHHGATVQEISRKLRVSLQAIWFWLAAYRRNGTKGLIGKRSLGTQLTFEQLDQLRGLRHITGKKTPRTRWTYPRLVLWVSKQWGITISAKRLAQIMRRNLDIDS